MESDVNATLSELERKLKELERELETVGRGGELDADPAQAGWTSPAEPQAPAAPPPPPPGATPFTASWHGTAGGQAAAPPPPPPGPNGAPPIPVAPPPQPTAWTTAAPAPRGPGLHQQLDELLAFRDRLVQTTDELVGELSRVLTELGIDAPAPASAPAPPPDPATTVLAGAVAVEVAPFGDLATLAAVEQALRRVSGVAAVAVRGLGDGRATLDVQLAAPVALGAALRAIAPVAVTVVDARDGRLILALTP